MEDNQTTIEIEPTKALTSEPIKFPDDDAQNSKPVGGNKTIDNQFTSLHNHVFSRWMTTRRLSSWGNLILYLYLYFVLEE